MKPRDKTKKNKTKQDLGMRSNSRGKGIPRLLTECNSKMTDMDHGDHISHWNQAENYEKDVLKDMKLIRCMICMHIYFERNFR